MQPDPLPAMAAPWHRENAEIVIQGLGSDAGSGLSSAQALERLSQYGRNEIVEAKRRGPLAIFAAQFADFMILILIAAAIVAGLIGDVTDTLVILAIVALNALVGFVQEFRAERAIAALKRMAAPSARVMRAGEALAVPASELVPGDVVLLETGNIVPADLRLIEAHMLKSDESALTGESQPVEKHPRALHQESSALGDRRNMLYKGTIVSYGRGRGVAVATGMRTELGRIATLLHAAEDVRTPLQKRLTRFGRVIALVVLALCVLLFVVGVLRDEPATLMLLTAISLAVAAIPEALPAVVTVALALGARKMVRNNALIRRLPAVETLGSVTYICSDKTGTLTENKMRVEEFCLGDRRRARQPGKGEPWDTLLRALALSNDARLSEGRLLGDPTEIALYEAAAAMDFEKEALARRFPRAAELPFDSERARMTTLHKEVFPAPSVAHLREKEKGGSASEEEAVIAYTKGAPETLLPLCREALGVGGRGPIDREGIQQIAEAMAAAGLRVLAIATRRFDALPAPLAEESIERELTFVGLVGLLDPPRAQVAEAVAICRGAGITPVMITGDHPATARAIAARLGIIGEHDRVLSGTELERLSLHEFEREVTRVRVYARVAPAQKIKIVRALQDQGEHVAMTGDGVNDAPALKRADIGVAMGITGTDVAKEAAHMILLDDNFATIVAAVREGRRIYDNIRKFIKFVMTGNSGEILTLFLAPFFGLPIPLLPAHILWVNLVTDGLPGLALAVEPAERGIMRRPPRPPSESVFARGIWQHILWVGFLIGTLCLVTQAWAIQTQAAHAQTMVFTVLTLTQMFHVLAIRSERDSLLTQGVFSNVPMFAAVVLTFLLQLALIYTPALNAVFHTQALTAGELLICVAVSSVVWFAVETEKLLIRRGWLYALPASA